MSTLLQNGVSGGIATALHCLSSRAMRSRPTNSGGSEEFMTAKKPRSKRSTEYSAKLRDPRWQKQRLKILSRDDFACQSCLDSESTLHVHHCYYEAGKEPWEYPEESLVTLCESCHAVETDIAYAEKQLLLKSLSRRGFLAAQFADLATAFHKAHIPASKEVYASALSWALSDPEMVHGIERAYFDHLATLRSSSGSNQ